jgi:hypothetical protein
VRFFSASNHEGVPVFSLRSGPPGNRHAHGTGDLTMRSMLLATLLLTTTPSFADAVTYKGTLDGRDILVELIDADDVPVGGRYTYLDEGADIPLDPAASPDGMIYLAEQAPCEPGLCMPNDGGQVDMPPYAATWGLTIVDGGASLVGTRNLEGDKGKAPNIELTEIGRRHIDPDDLLTPYGLHAYSSMLVYRPDLLIDAANSPYETALFALPKIEGDSMDIGGATVQFLIDPRTKFAYPRILSLPDGSDTSVINATFEDRQNRMSLDALNCLAFRYAAWGQSEDSLYMGGTLGDYDAEMIDVTYVSPTLVGWIEAGSLYCTGAHPYNHINPYTFEVSTGQALDLSRIFSAWVPRDWGAAPDEIIDAEIAAADPESYVWGPTAELMTFIRKRVDYNYFGDDELQRECLSDEGLVEHSTIRFQPNGDVMFGLSGFPHVMGPCNGDLFSVPLEDLKPFFAETAADYLPRLAQ